MAYEIKCLHCGQEYDGLDYVETGGMIWIIKMRYMFVMLIVPN
jgi:hypothetical protein